MTCSPGWAARQGWPAGSTAPPSLAGAPDAGQLRRALAAMADASLH
ncbi:hypothetical protein ABZ137_11595 [Streptomyces bobili]